MRKFTPGKVNNNPESRVVNLIYPYNIRCRIYIIYYRISDGLSVDEKMDCV